MPNAKELSLKNFHLVCMVYGKSGTGKTRFAGTFPKPYFFDYDGGMLTLRGQDIDYDHYDDVVVNGVVRRSAIDLTNQKLREFEKDCPYETLVFDSMTIYQDLLVAHITRASKTEKMNQGDWGSYHDYMKGLIFAAKRLGVNLVFTAHEQIIAPEEGVGTGVLILPQFFGKMATKVTAYFDEVYRTSVKRKGQETVYVLDTRAGYDFTAKSRLGELSSEENPSFGDIMEKVNKAEQKEGA